MEVSTKCETAVAKYDRGVHWSGIDTQDRNGQTLSHEQNNDTIKMATAVGATTVILQFACEMCIVPSFRRFQAIQAKASKWSDKKLPG